MWERLGELEVEETKVEMEYIKEEQANKEINKTKT